MYRGRSLLHSDFFTLNNDEKKEVSFEQEQINGCKEILLVSQSSRESNQPPSSLPNIRTLAMTLST
ncbi:unnamed protein product [Brugia timori]|uniref:Uncharacterized protein n=1 Tax=Brugia timori TaxID=42155 RepID=A0A3P7VVP5_9BILA|nr:unnamed protein product [Brugia timori]